ncbi:MAG: peptide chain release factor 3 [Alphaproteobacteria bacterium]|nr:MAG: peptide chain release factor 3 [Alphaproteobacteria bacterium]
MNTSSSSSALAEEIARRRTFAIISHPDAGKTTLTEKLLLYGGAIDLAGEVRARGERRRARSDWMKVERERGISVTSAVMTFAAEGCVFNLLDTPGHEDFSEDTYRVLSAVDSAIMVLDAAKGIEAQTLKLFEVCRLRDIPIITFINKMDREARDPFGLIDEIAERLALDVAPLTWPIGMGRDFKGCYHLLRDEVLLLDETARRAKVEGDVLAGLDDPRLRAAIGDTASKRLAEDVEMLRALTPAFDRASYLAGHMTPVFFGSALMSFGVPELITALVQLAPPPRSYQAVERRILPEEEAANAFVFKIQANMDPKHRDRMVFLRLVSGRLRRGDKLKHSGTGKTIAVTQPQFFLAAERARAEEAVAGDVIGIPSHGGFRIGDSLCAREILHFTGLPHFAPELLQRVRTEDPMKAKHLGRALAGLAEEGAARAFKALVGGEWIVGVVGALQFDVLADRLRHEYGLAVRFEPVDVHAVRWVMGEPRKLKEFSDRHRSQIAFDHEDVPVFLARSAWQLEKVREDWPAIRFLKLREATHAAGGRETAR